MLAEERQNLTSYLDRQEPPTHTHTLTHSSDTMEIQTVS